MAKGSGEASGAAPALKVEHDTTNEATVLAAALAMDDAARGSLLERFNPQTFLTPEYSAAWEGLRQLHQRKLGYDPATLQRLVGDKLDVALLGQLMSERPDVPDNLQTHLDWLVWDHQRATVAAGPLPAYLSALKNPASPPEMVRALAKQLAESHRGSSGAGRFLFDQGGIVRDQLAELEKRIEGRAQWPFGIEGFDTFEDGAVDDNGASRAGMRRVLPGAAPGMFTMLTGLSGSGKSTVASHFALGLARQPGRGKGLYCAWEPKGGMVLEFMAALTLGWSRTLLLEGLDQDDPRRKAKMPHAQKVLLESRMHGISKFVRFMFNPFRRRAGEKHQSNERNLDLLQETIVDAGASWVICDLLERCLVSTEPADEKEALFRVQGMADDTHTHIIGLAQQRKDVAMRPDKHPTAEGIKGSGAWYEAPDNVFGTHRAGQWKNVGDVTMEIDILKQRYGIAPLRVEFDWDGERGSLKNGHTIRYDQPGDAGATFGELEGDFTRPSKGKGSRGRSERR